MSYDWRPVKHGVRGNQFNRGERGQGRYLTLYRRSGLQNIWPEVPSAIHPPPVGRFRQITDALVLPRILRLVGPTTPDLHSGHGRFGHQVEIRGYVSPYFFLSLLHPFAFRQGPSINAVAARH